jgi:hypothetical protein
MAARAEVFAEAQGFDETLETGEDPDLCARIAARGFRIAQVPEMRCVHFGEPASLVAVFRRERWHGRGTRLRYGDGRLAPIMLTSLAFGAAGVLSFIALVAALLGAGGWWLAAVLVLLLGIPGVYAARYAKGAVHAAQLLLIYLAYFMGRAAALGVVVQRARDRQRTRRAGANQTPTHRRRFPPTIGQGDD